MGALFCYECVRLRSQAACNTVNLKQNTCAVKYIPCFDLQQTRQTLHVQILEELWCVSSFGLIANCVLPPIREIEVSPIVAQDAQSYEVPFCSLMMMMVM
jgi:hypothetical protein